MVSNRRVTELYAKGLGDNNKGSNIFWENETIYSYGYHFPMAHKTGIIYQGKEIVLWNEDGYSNTTAKHKSYTSGALHQEDRYILLDVDTEDLKVLIRELDNMKRESRGMNFDIYDRIMRRLEEKYTNSERKLAKARKYKERHERDMGEILEQKNMLRYLQFAYQEVGTTNSI